MPWKEASAMSLRWEIVQRAQEVGANKRRLAREFDVSRKTLYKWLGRFRHENRAGLRDRSRRPHTSPGRTPAQVEAKVLALRDEFGWGGRKISQRLRDLGLESVPPASTITEILRRHGRLDAEEGLKHRAWQRFEAEAPNDLWQMDFKGHFALASGQRCHPLTVLDDHSRYCLGLRACADEQRTTVQQELIRVFRRYGLPRRFLVDNGPPWGTESYDRVSQLAVWLIRLGVTVVHSRTHHPQTLGKDERFHKTLARELIRRQVFQDIGHAQQCFEPWRQVYNCERPHDSLHLAVPASRYRPSHRCYPEVLPAFEYLPGSITRWVDQSGRISYRNRLVRVGKALYGHRVALQPTDIDGELDVYFCHQKVTQIDLRRHNLEP